MLPGVNSYLYLLNKQGLHIAIKCKAKKSMLLFALLFSFFTFSAAANIAQQNTLLTPSELVLPNGQITRRSISYKSAAYQLYKPQSPFLNSKNNFAAAIAILDRLTATQYRYLARPVPLTKQAAFQYYTNIPHATEPAHQPSYRA
jgi:hypothetical protein